MKAVPMDMAFFFLRYKGVSDKKTLLSRPYISNTFTHG